MCMHTLRMSEEDHERRAESRAHDKQHGQGLIIEELALRDE